MRPYVVIKVLSNKNYTIRKIDTRYTQTLHRIRIRLYVREHRIPDVSVQSNEYLPDLDVKVSHNEWYAVSWEMEFGNEIDEHETSGSAGTNEQTVTQKATNMGNENMTQKVTDNRNDDTNVVRPTSSDISNLTTDGYNPRKKAKYNLRPNPKPNANPDFRRRQYQESRTNRSDQFIYWHTTASPLIFFSPTLFLPISTGVFFSVQFFFLLQ